MTAVRIKLAGADDAAAVADMLMRLAHEIGDAHRFRSDAETIHRHGFRDSPLFRSMIAERAGDHLGLALYFPAFSTTRGMPGLYVQDLWIAESERGTGLGRQLLAEATRHASQEWDARYLTLTVYADNTGAGAFYERLGFTTSAGERPLALDGSAFEQLKSHR